MIAHALTTVVTISDIINYLDEPVVKFLDFIERRVRGTAIEVLVIDEEGGSVEKLVLEVCDCEPEVAPDIDLLLAVMRDQQGRVWSLELQGWNYPADDLEKTTLREMISREGFTLNLCNAAECSPLLP